MSEQNLDRLLANALRQTLDTNQQMMDEIQSGDVPIDRDLLSYQRVIRNGKYYYPANSQYTNSSEVFCDRCDRGKLRACIGWNGMDLCLSCAARVEMTIFYNGDLP